MRDQVVNGTENTTRRRCKGGISGSYIVWTTDTECSIHGEL